ncbi:MAG: TatD family hydrolase [Candidatus Saccharimonadales bacterium]
MNELIDTHCHIHQADGLESNMVSQKWAQAGITSPEPLITSAKKEAGVSHMICVGCTLADSQQAIELATKHLGCWASIGIHPHEATAHVPKTMQRAFADLLSCERVIAIGECGLDYYYNHSVKIDQESILRFQLELAVQYRLPVIFHVREAFDDFWKIYDDYNGLRGVIHSFTADRSVLDQVLSRGLYCGLNGIVTFTKDPDQRAVIKAIPLDMMLLETDAPFLTPVPYRGTICQPKHVRITAEYLARLREEAPATIAQVTTENARQLFNF